MNTVIVEQTIPSPLGSLRLLASVDGLRAIEFPDFPDRKRWRPAPAATNVADARTPEECAAAEVIAHAQAQLEEYFAGTRTTFDLPLAPEGTGFQQKVWMALRAIPFGETASYGDVARRIGHPDAVRAVGAANGANPISIVVPCHRVIGADGRLTGFGGGLPAKRYLLDLERTAREPSLFSAPPSRH
ncbi:methylated-DNA-[protein]-cysteine S-methyltransferase [Luteibacter rhizovicinus]|uniref:Methylated-DNA--protein-cysteine methyltransferase n=1 Tax=Luteibacter rhizovicinus TaxID=242606 RepID=A0A4R3YGE5_9GAMM|nr:methylated-DNA--[protein]-cysteine S-methyltransferase [Luteibacter rhizovicinus]TCV91317.1 methylated-DNA-[protein]-cysteine S-methyltransferase [Luteibacter rhizovicinus]